MVKNVFCEVTVTFQQPKIIWSKLVSKYMIEPKGMKFPSGVFDISHPPESDRHKDTMGAYQFLSTLLSSKFMRI